MTEDDPEAFGRPSLGPELIRCQNRWQPGYGITSLTIYNGMDCKLYSPVATGSYLDAAGAYCGDGRGSRRRGLGMSGGRIASKEGWGLFALSVTVFGAALALFGSADGAGAQDRRGSSSGVFVSEMSDVQRVSVILNKSRTFRVDSAFSTIVSGSPEIAEVRSLSDDVIHIQ